MSLIVLFSCAGDEVFVDYLHPRQVVTEFSYIQNEAKSIIPGSVIVTSLEHPEEQLSNKTPDTETLGIDRFNVKFEFNGNFYYRIQENAVFKFRLINKNTNTVVFELNSSRLTADDILITAGDYIYELEIDKNLIDTNFTHTPIYIQPDIAKLKAMGYLERQLIGKYKNIDIANYISYNSCEECDLIKADFSYMNLSGNENNIINLTKANLKNAHGIKTEMAYYNFNSITLNAVQFDSSNFSNSKFNQILDANYSTFQHSKFFETEFLNSTATFMKFNDSYFRDSKMQNSIFYNSEFRATEYQFVTCTDNDFTDCTFRGSSLYGSDFSNSILYNADISYADVRGAIFCNTVTKFMKYNMIWRDSTTKCLDK